MRSSRWVSWLLAIACLAACQEEAPEHAAPPSPIPTVEVPPAPERVGAPNPAEPSHPFNIILISIDTLRADHLSAYGYSRPTSPSIDALAASGLLFRQAYSHSPKTTPSHMSLMTSLYPEVHRVLNRTGRVVDSKLSFGIPTLAEILHAAGYRTAAFTAGGNVSRYIGFGRGFERFQHMPVDAAPTFEAGADALRAWVAEGGERPFFLFLHTVQVHDPYLPPKAARARFVDPDDTGKNAGYYAGGILSEREALARRAKVAGHSIAKEFWTHVDPDDAADLAHLRDLYDACIHYTDEQIGRLLAAVDELGLREATAVVILSDHGEEFGEHGGTRHNSVFEEVLHVPLVVRLPPVAGLDATGLVNSVVRLVDVMPTLLDLVGLPIPAHLNGRSLLPLVDGDETLPRTVFAHWRERGVRSLRAGRFKLIRIPEELHIFDLVRDPGERRPIEDERPDLRIALVPRLRALMENAHATAAAVDPGQPEPIDAQTRNELRELGYLD